VHGAGQESKIAQSSKLKGERIKGQRHKGTKAQRPQNWRTEDSVKAGSAEGALYEIRASGFHKVEQTQEMEFKLTHLGGKGCVTGSCRLLEIRGFNILVDCGTVQGSDVSVPIEKWPVKPSQVNFIFLTHAHIDHIGLLPALVRQGFKGEIIGSHPTVALILPMLNDAMRFEALPAAERDKIAQTTEELSWGFEYGEEFDLGKDVAFELGRAGHILGSCFIRFEDKKNGSAVIFSGDLGNCDTPILNDPETAGRVDLLLLESTYGNRLHEGREDRMMHFAAVLDHCLSDGGKVFIPAFSMGRTQEILYELDRIFSSRECRGRFPRLASKVRPPVFVDSPLGIEITKVYSTLTDYWDHEAKALLDAGDHPMHFERLYGVEKHVDHAELLDMKGPAVIIAGSGMCMGGRIVNHLERGIGRPENDVVFVGYQAPGTTGRAIQERSGGNRTVVLSGEAVKIEAGVHTLSGYSAHADQKGLLDWVERMAAKPGKVELVHGEPEEQKALAAKLVERGYSVAR
jgi:metallo-beta-lactamase family protein